MSSKVTSRSSLIGVAISLIGNVLISLALNCQKLAHVRLEQQDNEEQDGTNGDALQSRYGVPEESQRLLNDRGEVRPYGSATNGTKRQRTKTNGSTTDDETDRTPKNDAMPTKFLKSRLWWLGISLMTLGEFGNFLSYGFAPASLVAPLGAVALLSNVVISPIMLKERFHITDIGGILLAIIGAVTVVFSSKQSDATLDPDELWTALCQKGFVAYFIVAVVLAALLAWASSTTLGQRYILLDVGVCALLGGFTVLSTKGLSSLLSQGNPFDLIRYPIFYGLVVVLAGTALAQITYLNRALQRFDSREVIPTQFVMFTISAIVGSAILYRDFADMDAHRLINFLFGCLTTFAGVYFLTRQKQSEGDEEESPRNEENGASGHSSNPVESQGGRADLAVPIIVPSTNRAPSLSVTNAKRGGRAVTTGAIPTLSTLHGQAQAGLLTLTPANSSVNSNSGSIPKYIITRRSIFNPAFPVAFIEAGNSGNRRT